MTEIEFRQLCRDARIRASGGTEEQLLWSLLVLVVLSHTISDEAITTGRRGLYPPGATSCLAEVRVIVRAIGGDSIDVDLIIAQELLSASSSAASESQTDDPGEPCERQREGQV
jgi:hypothetical protein